jgi:hypothetical protein
MRGGDVGLMASKLEWASMVVYVCMYVLLGFMQTPKHTNDDAGTASQSSV